MHMVAECSGDLEDYLDAGVAAEVVRVPLGLQGVRIAAFVDEKEGFFVVATERLSLIISVRFA